MRTIILTLLTTSLTTSTSLAVDVVYRKSTSTPASGEVTSAGRTEVVVERGSNKETVPANDIVNIRWDGEPARMNIARSSEEGGKLDAALQEYEKLISDVTDANVKADLEFLIARTKAKQALANPAGIDDAVKGLQDFRTAHGDSYRYYEALNYLGQLLMAKSDTDAARAVFAELGQAPWPDYQMAAQIFDGRLKLQANDIDGALAAFNQVIQNTPDSAAAPELARKYEAMLGKASCLNQKQQFDEAATVLDEVVKKAPPGNSALQAEAYVRQGDALQAQGKLKEAVLAYLHVDVLFPAQKSLHAEALYHLAKLAVNIKDPQLAADARSKLENDYKGNPWEQKLSGG